MIDDWQITHELADLPPDVWAFVKKHKFFGMIIPKHYGGLGFSALAHSAVLQKLATMSATVASTVAVPNSLGPAELLLHYGSDEQKNHYLPRLADRRGNSLLRADRSVRGFRCHLDSRLRHRLQADGRWRRNAGHEAHLRQALHHAGAGRHRGRPGLPPVRPRAPAGRQGRSRHHAGAAAALDPGPGDRSSPLSAERAVPERSAARQGRVRADVGADRRPAHGRPRLAHAGRMPLGGPRDFAAVQRHRRRARCGCGRPARMRACASSSAWPSPASKASRRRWRASAA